MTLTCPSCGARSIEDMEGNEYTSHMSGCPYRHTFGRQRRSWRDRLAVLGRKFDQIDWYAVFLVLGVIAIVLFLMYLGFYYLEEAGGR